jgi:hypothetical protein
MPVAKVAKLAAEPVDFLNSPSASSGLLNLRLALLAMIADRIRGVTAKDG